MKYTEIFLQVNNHVKFPIKVYLKQITIYRHVFRTSLYNL